MDLLSHSKRRYIENWRKTVCQYMENGNICRVTIADMTPEPPNHVVTNKRPSAEHKQAMAERSPPPANEASHTAPAIKFGYSHGIDGLKRHQSLSSKTRERRERKVRVKVDSDNLNNRHSVTDLVRTVLPPSPNGFAVQNGMDVIQNDRNSYTAHSRSAILKSLENMADTELPELAEAKDYTRRSSKQLAREIYDKYNMKSKNNNTLPGRKHTINGMEQYSMPWRSKTFLTLPVRFSGNRPKHEYKLLPRDKTYDTNFNDVLSLDEMETDGHYWSNDIDM